MLNTSPTRALVSFALLLLASCAAMSSETGDSNDPTNNAAAPDAPNNDAAQVDIDAERDATQPDTSPNDVAPDAPPDDGLYHLPQRALCEGTWQASTATDPVGDADLVEASGLVASPQNPGVLWSHNDSGDSARLFAISTEGRALGRLALEGVNAVDIEDIAAAPCPDRGGPCLWVADTGNNARNRDDQALYVVAEPTIDPNAGNLDRSAAPLATIPITLPEGLALDIEALVVAPDASAFWIIEKTNESEARLLVADGPFADGTPALLRVLTSFRSPGLPISNGRSITAADLHPSGTRLAIRLYVGSFEYRLQPGQTLADLADITPTQIAAGPLTESQGEAIAYGEAGDEIWTISEDNENNGEPLHHYLCAP